jgi:spoIIIJ-associated protein
MNREYTGSGKTIEEAITAACAALDIDRNADNLEIEVLSAPTKGFMGIGASDAKVRVCVVQDDDETDAVRFLSEVMRLMKIDCSVIPEKKEDESVRIELRGNNMGVAIGRRGETLDALQYLTALVANKGKSEFVKITLDVENYRKKREETLAALAQKLAGKAVKYRHNVSLEPMNAYERRIIHSTLQNYKDVSTFSTGAEPNRKVIISYSPGRKNTEKM